MRRPRAIAFFDVDETLIRVQSLFRFLEYRLWLEGGDVIDYLNTCARLQQLASSSAGREAANRAYYRLYAGARVADVRAQGAAWFDAELRDPDLFHPEVLASLRGHREAGHLVVLVSGSFRACLEPMAAHLGADEVLCSLPRVSEGRYTGEVELAMVGSAKRRAATELMARLGAHPGDCHAYGDHACDLPLLQVVGHPVAVGRDPNLVAAADVGEWSRIGGHRRPALVTSPAWFGGGLERSA